MIKNPDFFFKNNMQLRGFYYITNSNNKYDQCLDCNTGAFPQNRDPEVGAKKNLVNGWY